MHILPQQGLYAVTDCDNLSLQQLLESTAAILANGAVILQYRNKSDSTAEKRSKAEKLQRLCNDFNVPFIINDDIDLARSLAADGVHIGKEDMDCRKARVLLGPERIIGVSCYNDLQRAASAVNNGASYVAFGAFFPTPSKLKTEAADVNLVRKARTALTVPLAAIGGITPQNGGELVAAGVNYLAVISGLYASTDPAESTRQYVRLFKQDKTQDE